MAQPVQHPRLLRRIATGLLTPAFRSVAAGEPLPAGGCLLVANHQSYVDWGCLQLAANRDLRFVAHSGFFQLWWSRWFLEAFDTVPIDGGSALGSLRSVSKCLAQGGAVVLFPEGEITRCGGVGRLREGYRIAAARAEVPVVPVWIESLWGSRFSYSGGALLSRAQARAPRPRPVIVKLGAALAADAATPERLRAVWSELAGDSFASRSEVREAHAAVVAARRLRASAGREALIDARPGRRPQRWSAADLCSLAARVASALRQRGARKLACWLPPGPARCFTELAAAAAGVPLVALESGAPPDLLEAALLKAKPDFLITNRASIRAQPRLQTIAPTLQIEDLVGNPGAGRLLLEALLARFRFKPAACGSVWAAPAIQILQLACADWAHGCFHFMPGSVPGWWSTWLPLLTGATVVTGEPGSEPGWLAERCRRHRIDTLAATAPQIEAWLDHGEPLSGCGLRRLLICDPTADSDRLARAESSWGIPVLKAWCDPVTGWLFSIETFDRPGPENGRPHLGRKTGSAGRQLPGVGLRCVHPDTLRLQPHGSAGALQMRIPALGVSEWTETGADGWIDADGFVFLSREG